MSMSGRYSSRALPDVRRRIDIVQYLRGLASLAVAWFHLTNSWTDGVRVSGSFGWLGVDVFFVISGFVIPYSISMTYETYSLKTFVNFISRRFVRIEFPYIVSIIVVIVLAHFSALSPGFQGKAADYTTAQIISNIFYIASWTGQEWMEPVYWTLAYEFAFYLTIGLLFSVLFGKRRSLAYWFAVGIFVLAVSRGFMGSLVLLFVMGSAVFRYIMGRERLVYATGIVIVCTIVTVLAGNLASAMAGLVAATTIGLGRGFQLSGRPGWILTYLGTISYSLYLIHVPVGGRVVNLGRRFVHGEFGHLIVSGLALAVALAFAHLFYVFVERPALRKARQLVDWGLVRAVDEVRC